MNSLHFNTWILVGKKNGLLYFVCSPPLCCQLHAYWLCLLDLKTFSSPSNTICWDLLIPNTWNWDYFSTSLPLLFFTPDEVVKLHFCLVVVFQPQEYSLYQSPFLPLSSTPIFFMGFLQTPFFSIPSNFSSSHFSFNFISKILWTAFALPFPSTGTCLSSFSSRPAPGCSATGLSSMGWSKMWRMRAGDDCEGFSN